MLNSIYSLKSNNKIEGKKVANNYATSPIQKSSMKTTMAVSPALAHMNYFLGSQLVSFKGHSCSTSDFKVSRLNDTPCGCCGMPMLSAKQNSALIREIDGKVGQDLINTLTANKQYFRGNESAIVNYVINEAKNDDMASIDMIIARSKGADTHKIFNDEQKRVLNNIKSTLLTNHVKNDKLTSYVDNNLLLLESGNESLFKRNTFLKGLNENLKENGNHELRHNVLDKAVKLPVSEVQIDRFFERYSEGSKNRPEKLIARLLSTATVTAEHIRPQSLGGRDNTGNYMGECMECNSKRGNYNLNEYWMTNYPNMPESAQKNVDFVTEKIVNGEMGEGYNDYPEDLKNALSKETNGTIKLTVKNPEEIEKQRKK